MGKTSFAVKLDSDFQQELKEFCESHGFKQSSFVERALREQMERDALAEDLLDFYMLRPTEGHASSLDDYLQRRK